MRSVRHKGVLVMSGNDHTKVRSLSPVSQGMNRYKLALGVGLILCALPLLWAALTAYQLTPNFPITDQIEIAYFYAENAGDPGWVLSHLLDHYNEHRIPFTHLFTALSSLLLDWNLRAEVIFNFALGIGILLLIYRFLHRHAPEAALIATIAVSLFTFGIRGHHTFGISFQHCFLLCLLFLLLGIEVLIERAVSWSTLLLAAFCALCATLSLASGLFAWIVFGLVMIGKGYRQPRHLVVWTVISIGVIVWFRWGQPPVPSNDISLLNNILQYIGAVFTYLASPFFNQQRELLPPAIIMGAIGVLLTTLQFLWYWRRVKRLSDPLLLYLVALVAFCGASALVTGNGRLYMVLSNVPDQLLASRYVIHSQLLWIALIVFTLINGWAFWREQTNYRASLSTVWKPILLGITSIVLSAAVVLSLYSSVRERLYFMRDRAALETCYLQFALLDSSHPLCIPVTWDPKWNERVKTIAERRQALFAPSTLEISLVGARPTYEVSGTPIITENSFVYQGVQTPAVMQHPMSVVRFTLDFPPGYRSASFTSTIYIPMENLLANPDMVQDGVVFSAAVFDAAGNTIASMSQIFDPNVDNAPIPFSLDFSSILSENTDQLFFLELKTEMRENPVFDWAYWGEPHITLSEDANVAGATR